VNSKEFTIYNKENIHLIFFVARAIVLAHQPVCPVYLKDDKALDKEMYYLVVITLLTFMQVIPIVISGLPF